MTSKLPVVFPAGEDLGDDCPRPQLTPQAQVQSTGGIGIALSGGGYRAALFHLGVLRRLNELGVLHRPDWDAVSSVSGGSITAAALAKALSSDAPILPNDWDSRVAQPLKCLTRTNIRLKAVILGFLDGLIPTYSGSGWRGWLPWNLFFNRAKAVRVLEEAYRRFITDEPLSALPRKPEFTFCATDLAFGANWVFRRDFIGDYRAGFADTVAGRWPIARAVAASACFPPIFNPLPIGLAAADFTTPGTYAGPDRNTRVERIRLSDGGVYDNLGLEPLWDSNTPPYQWLLVSDGGGIFRPEDDWSLPSRVVRYQGIQEYQDRALRKRWLFAADRAALLHAVYFGITSPSWMTVQGATIGYSCDLAPLIAAFRTDLDSFSEAEAAILENHGYLVAERSMRRFGHGLVPNWVPVALPHPEWSPPIASEQKIGLSPLKPPGGNSWAGFAPGRL